jgi:diaminohydroxyphosphoribosylaminopyrimidine deaminase/5-amino-6-(5-phosphoribosylamino)uracil reductase
MTLDGRIADASGASRWISGPQSRAMVRKLRNRVDAVMVGGRTVANDDPALLAPGSRVKKTVRVIVDSGGGIPPDSRVLTDECAGNTIVATTKHCPESRRRQYGRNGARVWIVPRSRGKVSTARLLARLGRNGILHVLCEGGGRLAASLISGGYADELVFFVAPRILGAPGTAPVVGGRSWNLADGPSMEFTEYARSGKDIVIRARPARRSHRKRTAQPCSQA